MIHEEICTYEVAKLAKEKGFDIHCVPFYALEDFTAEYIDDIGEFYEVDFEKGYLYLNYPIKGLLHKEKMLPAPTQSLLQRWMREERGYYVYPFFDNDELKWTFVVREKTGDKWIPLVGETPNFDVFEEAMDAGLKFVLENFV